MTDWSLLVLKFSADANTDAAVLCELPWLGIKEIEVETMDSTDLYEISGQKAASTSFVSIFPQLDISKLVFPLF